MEAKNKEIDKYCYIAINPDDYTPLTGIFNNLDNAKSVLNNMIKNSIDEHKSYYGDGADRVVADETYAPYDYRIIKCKEGDNIYICEGQSILFNKKINSKNEAIEYINKNDDVDVKLIDQPYVYLVSQYRGTILFYNEKDAIDYETKNYENSRKLKFGSSVVMKCLTNVDFDDINNVNQKDFSQEIHSSDPQYFKLQEKLDKLCNELATKPLFHT